MKKKILASVGLTIGFSALLIVGSISFEGTHSVYANAGGSPGGRTDSPGDGSSCINCHTGTINSGIAQVAITSIGLANGYVPGQTYTISAAVTGTSSSKIGFEVTAEKDLDNSKIGSIIITDATRTKAVNSSAAITHNSAAGTTASSGSNGWTFDWVAPSAGTGDITFYGAFNVTNSSSNTNGDEVYSGTFSVQEAVATGLGEFSSNQFVSLFPNPAKSFVQVSTNMMVKNISIFNLAGEKVIETTEFQNKINIEKLSLGIYFVKIQTDKDLLIEKLIVQ